MHTTHSNTQYKNESSTVKWAQWDKTQSRELLVCSYMCASQQQQRPIKTSIDIVLKE